MFAKFLSFLTNEYTLATAAVIAVYLVGVWAYGTVNGTRHAYSPVVLTAGKFRRGSLANIQVLFFSLVVFWLVALNLGRGEGLPKLNSDILLLLGIAAVGTGTVRGAAAARKRLSNENWAWLKNKGWVSQDIERTKADRKPIWGDLLTSDGAFEVTRFQSLSFSLLVGGALIKAGIDGNTANFDVPDAYLGILGLSQIVYVGGKAVAPNAVGQLNDQLTKLRALELKFTDAVSLAWKSIKPGKADANAAMNAAPVEYNAYLAAAELAAELVSERTGNVIDDAKRAPKIPQI